MALSDTEKQVRREVKALNERMAWTARTYGIDSSEYASQLRHFESAFGGSDIRTYTATSGAKSISLEQSNIKMIAGDILDMSRVRAAQRMLATPSVFKENDRKMSETYARQHKGKEPTKQQLTRFKRIKELLDEYFADPASWSPDYIDYDDEETQAALDRYMGVMHQSHKSYEELYRAVTEFEGLKWQAYQRNWEIITRGAFTPRRMQKSVDRMAAFMADVNKMKGV